MRGVRSGSVEARRVVVVVVVVIVVVVVVVAETSYSGLRRVLHINILLDQRLEAPWLVWGGSISAQVPKSFNLNKKIH